ncbi:MAG TPA: sn-glycerol-3-phosphate ABC transporter ATP-binding protein UgpC [Spirochaetes bacterium]|nr:sn-glycerol-3-phosphate ABC transporter ATP-binding protein UgpC [Spirochaetota bacterium]
MVDNIKNSNSGQDLAIELVEVTKKFGDTTVLRDINLDILDGEFFVLLGPSGCGKSTMLKIISGLEDATGGEVYINDRLVNYVAPKDRDVAMVFQNYALYPHMTVERNIGYPLKMRKVQKNEIHKKVVDVASLLEIEEFLDKYPEQLSGGQRQRVALGRALIREPIAFLFDEPLSNLDALLRVQMRDELLKLHRRLKKTTIYVTHDQVEAMTMADRIVILNKGVIQQIGKPHEVYRNPVNLFVATFIGSPQMNIMHGTLNQEGSGLVFSGPFKLDLKSRFTYPGERSTVALGIRPEDINVEKNGGPDSIAGEVGLVEPIGSDTLVNVEIADKVFCKVRVPESFEIREGEHIKLNIQPDKIHLFDSGGTRIMSTKK